MCWWEMKSRFWADKWLGEESLQQMFPRIFRICREKEMTTAEVGKHRHVDGSWDLQLRRKLFSKDIED